LPLTLRCAAAAAAWQTFLMRRQVGPSRRQRRAVGASCRPWDAGL